jgi:hypothetical protein
MSSCDLGVSKLSWETKYDLTQGFATRAGATAIFHGVNKLVSRQEKPIKVLSKVVAYSDLSDWDTIPDDAMYGGEEDMYELQIQQLQTGRMPVHARDVTRVVVTSPHEETPFVDQFTKDFLRFILKPQSKIVFQPTMTIFVASEHKPRAWIDDLLNEPTFRDHFVWYSKGKKGFFVIAPPSPPSKKGKKGRPSPQSTLLNLANRIERLEEEDPNEEVPQSATKATKTTFQRGQESFQSSFDTALSKGCH